MAVRRIVLNIATENIKAAQHFYGEILGLEVLMDQTWICTYGTDNKMRVQISFATEGGSGTPVPDISIEVDDVDGIHVKMKDAGFPITYGPANEPWGVRRFYVKDPFGKTVNILSHSS
ncbi:glyoxalase [Parapedobacter defluvii]|uniref:Glyoxalase n=1 Tax=Parapedobacter defluvii TaxID=2045106 RepID=A0ABQ1MW05_9SPHI|nr:VOC family protein [Parapedobacter defluvii]RQP18494.1 MAG: glyoxalase [Parapedobacter sp.]GGC48161.1 glyoxalase [Parapedobacter defluvii]